LLELKLGATSDDKAVKLTVELLVGSICTMNRLCRSQEISTGRGCADAALERSNEITRCTPGHCRPAPWVLERHDAVPLRLPPIARVMTLLSSRSHRTELATAAQRSQSPASRPVVENASWRKGT
jgi:hypothetical protein